MTPPLERHIFTLADALKLLLGEQKRETGLSTKPSTQTPLGKLRRDGFSLSQNKIVLLLVISIMIALLGVGLYASEHLTYSSPAASVAWGNGTLVARENAQVKVTAQYQGNYTGSLGAAANASNKSIQFLVAIVNNHYTGLIFGNPYNFRLYTSDQQLIKPSTASFRSGGFHSDPSSKSGDMQSGILVFEINKDATPVELRYDDLASTPLVLPVQM
jgi:hypothetical protein